MDRRFQFGLPHSSFNWLGKQASERGLSVAAYLRLLILDAIRRSGQ